MYSGSEKGSSGALTPVTHSLIIQAKFRPERLHLLSPEVVLGPSLPLISVPQLGVVVPSSGFGEVWLNLSL